MEQFCNFFYKETGWFLRKHVTRLGMLNFLERGSTWCARDLFSCLFLSLAPPTVPVAWLASHDIFLSLYLVRELFLMIAQRPTPNPIQKYNGLMGPWYFCLGTLELCIFRPKPWSPKTLWEPVLDQCPRNIGLLNIFWLFWKPCFVISHSHMTIFTFKCCVTKVTKLVTNLTNEYWANLARK